MRGRRERTSRWPAFSWRHGTSPPSGTPPAVRVCRRRLPRSPWSAGSARRDPRSTGRWWRPGRRCPRRSRVASDRRQRARRRLVAPEWHEYQRGRHRCDEQQEIDAFANLVGTHSPDRCHRRQRRLVLELHVCSVMPTEKPRRCPDSLSNVALAQSSSITSSESRSGFGLDDDCEFGHERARHLVDVLVHDEAEHHVGPFSVGSTEMSPYSRSQLSVSVPRLVCSAMYALISDCAALASP
jgi:hypothetical protein